MAEKKDLRVTKSKQAIRKALLELIKEKGYANVTITDIANRAMINRKTFYMHYETKDDLYYELLNDIINTISKDKVLIRLSGLSNTEQRDLLTNTLTQIKENKDIINILMSDNTNLSFTEMLKQQLINDLILKTSKELECKNTLFTFELLSEAYFSIFILIIKWWINTDNISTDTVLDMILDFFSKKPLELLGLNFENNI